MSDGEEDLALLKESLALLVEIHARHILDFVAVTLEPADHRQFGVPPIGLVDAASSENRPMIGHSERTILNRPDTLSATIHVLPRVNSGRSSVMVVGRAPRSVTCLEDDVGFGGIVSYDERDVEGVRSISSHRTNSSDVVARSGVGRNVPGRCHGPIGTARGAVRVWNNDCFRLSSRGVDDSINDLETSGGIVPNTIDIDLHCRPVDTELRLLSHVVRRRAGETCDSPVPQLMCFWRDRSCLYSSERVDREPIQPRILKSNIDGH